MLPPHDPDRASVDPWAQLLQAARMTAAEQDVDLRYVAVLQQPDGPDLSGIIGCLDSDIYDDAVAARLVAIKRGAIENGRPRQGRVDLEQDGVLRTYEVTATPRRNERGDVVGVLSVAVELTQVLQAQDRRRPTETRLSRILDSAVDAIVSTGPDRKVVYFNPAAARMFGVPAAEAIGSDLERFVPPTRPAEHPTQTTDAAHVGATGPCTALGTLRALRASGEEFPIEASVSLTGEGDDQLCTLIIRDRSAPARLQAQLLQSQKLQGIGRLAGGVAHDFNNLLTVILGYCELLQMRQRGGTELEEINNAARRASQLTRQLLAFSHRQVFQVETLDLNGLIRGVNRMVRRTVGENVTLATDLSDDVPWVVGDVGQLEQVVLNLVANARDAMPGGGTVCITTRVVEHADPTADCAARRSVQLTVADSGVGLSDDEQARIFEPFFTTRADADAGLGLATAYGIVTQTGGHIECESGPGRGTRFRVSLPLAAPPPNHPSSAMAATSDSSHGHETVLLVEREARVRALAARALREDGYDVLEASDVEGALRHVEHPRLAIVVADALVPGRSGSDFSVEIGLRRPHVPVLLMAGYTEALRQRPVDGAHLLRKPFTPTDLIAKIRALLDRPPTATA